MTGWRSRPIRTALVAAAALGLLATAAPGARPGSPAGGTYRVGWERDLTDGFDPTGEVATIGIYSNLLLRTLVGYDHVAGPAGARIVPDLATSVPAPTKGGRTYAFTLKRGVRFGPPVDRAITSNDIRWAIERAARPRNGGLYAFYFDVIRGYDAYRAGKARTIAGIETPDARTITFDLIRPTGDFLHRLALPAAAPIPPEVGRCFEGEPGAYGRDVVSSGPYMVEGSDALDIRSCGSITRPSGSTDTSLTLVRNPGYDPATDSRAARENNPDRFVFVSGLASRQTRNAIAIVEGLARGELDDAVLTSSPKVIGKYAAVAKKRGLLRVDSPGWLLYVSLNLTKPPFDDVHVRRALSLILDKAALREAWGGPMAGRIAQHLIPDSLLDGELEDFAPFRTRGDHGDLARARAEMAKSRYGDRSGLCTAKACKRAELSPLLEFEGYAAGQRMAPIVKADAARIGIAFRLRSRTYDKFFLPSANIEVSPSAAWYQLFPDPSNFVDPLMRGTAITPTLNVNASLVGITPAHAARLGVHGAVGRVPSVDADLGRCAALTGARRTDCYAALDRKLSTELVAWIPFLWRDRITILGPQVAKWQFDASTGITSFAHVALER
jgi:peptide/nickel transport system substrate-binding protein